mgnify:CR=1 FL=1
MTGETDKPDTPNPADDPTVQSGMHGDGHGVGQDDPTIQSEAGTGAGTAGTVRMFSKADAPKEIGPYKIIQVLGEGGFGMRISVEGVVTGYSVPGGAAEVRTPALRS